MVLHKQKHFIKDLRCLTMMLAAAAQCITHVWESYCLLQGPNSDVSYEIVGDEQAQEYFAINSKSGAISLRKPLVDTNILAFNVSDPPPPFLLLILGCVEAAESFL